MKKLFIIFLFNSLFANNCITHKNNKIYCSYIYFNDNKTQKNIIDFKIKDRNEDNIYLIKNIPLNKILKKQEEKKYFTNYLNKNKNKLRENLKNLLCPLFKNKKLLYLNNIYLKLDYNITNLNIIISKNNCK